MKPSPELIEEARKRGIVPGATIQCAAVVRKCHGTVAEKLEWLEANGTLWAGRDHDGKELCAYSAANCRWAAVITPAPSQAEGLKEGDAVECGPAMRAAIIELAIELGVADERWAKAYSKEGRGYTWTSNDCRLQCGIHTQRELHTPEAFIAKMRVTAAQPKPIKIGDNTVKFNADKSITVGCTTVPFTTIEAVYNKLK